MSEKPFRRCRTFKYRLHPTKHQEQALTRLLSFQRELYNAALEERIGAWKWEQRSVSYFDQCKTLSTLKDVRPEVLESGVTLCRDTPARRPRLRRLLSSGATRRDAGVPEVQGCRSLRLARMG